MPTKVKSKSKKVVANKNKTVSSKKTVSPKITKKSSKKPKVLKSDQTESIKNLTTSEISKPKQTEAQSELKTPNMKTRTLLANVVFVGMIVAVISSAVLIQNNFNSSDVQPEVAGVQSYSDAELGFQFKIPQGWEVKKIENGVVLNHSQSELGQIVLTVSNIDSEINLSSIVAAQKNKLDNFEVKSNKLELDQDQVGVYNAWREDAGKIYWWRLLSPQYPSDSKALSTFRLLSNTFLSGEEVKDSQTAIFYAKADGYNLKYPLSHRVEYVKDQDVIAAFKFLPEEAIKSLVAIQSMDKRTDAIILNSDIPLELSIELLEKAGNKVETINFNEGLAYISNFTTDEESSFQIAALANEDGTLWLVERVGEDSGLDLLNNLTLTPALD